jgi:hypothetical protein
MSNPNGIGGFVKGKSGNPNGRPKKAIEERYLKSLYSVLKQSDWKEIVEMAVKQAKRGDSQARKWLSDYALGTPVNRMELLGKDGTPQEIGVVAVDYRFAIAALAPGSMGDSDPSSESESTFDGAKVG